MTLARVEVRLIAATPPRYGSPPASARPTDTCSPACRRPSPARPTRWPPRSGWCMRCGSPHSRWSRHPIRTTRRTASRRRGSTCPDRQAHPIRRRPILGGLIQYEAVAW